MPSKPAAASPRTGPLWPTVFHDGWLSSGLSHDEALDPGTLVTIANDQERVAVRIAAVDPKSDRIFGTLECSPKCTKAYKRGNMLLFRKEHVLYVAESYQQWMDSRFRAAFHVDLSALLQAMV